MALTQKHCTACHKGVGKLSSEEASNLLTQLDGWSISEDGAWLKKSYTFKNFAQALIFINHVGAIAESESHHPDITFGWGYANIALQTHAIGGLHENDFILAAKIDNAKN